MLIMDLISIPGSTPVDVERMKDLLANSLIQQALFTKALFSMFNSMGFLPSAEINGVLELWEFSGEEK